MIDTEEAAKAWVRALPECDDTAMARLELLAELLTEENARQNQIMFLSMY